MRFQFTHADASKRFALASLYLDNTEFVNNWDLVDVSAPALIGDYIGEYYTVTKKTRGPNGVSSSERVVTTDGMKLLRTLAHSTDLWERRIGIVATYALIKRGIVAPTIDIAKILIGDKHDLIQKAVGWMLREVGKKDESTLHAYLAATATTLPRTTLRYAIERMTPSMREHYMMLGKDGMEE